MAPISRGQDAIFLSSHSAICVATLFQILGVDSTNFERATITAPCQAWYAHLIHILQRQKNALRFFRPLTPNPLEFRIGHEALRASYTFPSLTTGSKVFPNNSHTLFGL